MPNSLLIRFKRAKICFVILGSSAEVASSESKILGFSAKALAMATRCFCPPESAAG